MFKKSSQNKGGILSATWEHGTLVLVIHVSFLEMWTFLFSC